MAGVVRGLTLAALVALVGLTGALVPSVARASSNLSYDTAKASCTSWNSTHNYGAGSVTGCYDATNGAKEIWSCTTFDGSSGLSYKVCDDFHQRFTYTGTKPSPCESRPSYKGMFGSNVSVCMAGCKYAPDDGASGDGDGPMKHCVRTTGGQSVCSATTMYRPTGEECDGGPPDATSPPPPPPKPPKVCGGASCYDPTTGQYCAVGADGAQVCVQGPKPGDSGGCVSGGSTTLCVGNPPPNPDKGNVPDPPTDITGSDTHTDQPTGPSGPTGPPSTTIINNYDNGTNGGTGEPNNGGSSGDVGDPPSASSSPKPAGDGTSASGGGDCNSPPVCEGSAAVCMVARQTWLLRCQGAGDTSNDADTTVPGLDGVGETPGAGFFTDGGGLLDKLDSSGFGGGGQCPAFPEMHIESLGIDWNTTPDWWCDALLKLSYLIVAMGAFTALTILGAFKR